MQRRPWQGVSAAAREEPWQGIREDVERRVLARFPERHQLPAVSFPVRAHLLADAALWIASLRSQ
jgi:hypothetical protein